ncbi:MAG TPA: hypothetical protein VGI73_08375 [Solirubrobacterales bacterium]|jgi:hypothetical protein
MRTRHRTPRERLGRLLRRREHVDLAAMGPYELAAFRFNHSDAGHTVAGLTRTLGVPKVSVGARGGSATEVRVTCAWELTWHQWSVDLGEEAGPVLEIAEGRRLAELEPAARQWNAAAAADGRITVAGGR